MNSNVRTIVVTALDDGFIHEEGGKEKAMPNFSDTLQGLARWIEMQGAPKKGETNTCRITIEFEYNVPKQSRHRS